MRDRRKIHKILNYLIATVWLINGLVCKLLNLVPRHQLIISRIFGDEEAEVLTRAIGLTEIVIAIWILSSIRSRMCAITQIIIVVTMNALEFFLAPDLLLFGKINSLVALFFVAIVYFNEFILRKKFAKHA